MTSNDLEMTLGDLQMTLRPPTTVSLARTSKMLQKLSNIRVSSSYNTRFIEEKPYFSLFFWEVAHFKRIYTLRVKKYFTCGASFTENAIIIPRICSEIESRENRFSELKEFLIERGYRSAMIDNAISKARNIKREDALKRVVQPDSNRRPIFLATFDPRLPSIPEIKKNIGEPW